MCDEMDEMSEQ